MDEFSNIYDLINDLVDDMMSMIDDVVNKILHPRCYPIRYDFDNLSNYEISHIKYDYNLQSKMIALRNL